MSKRKRILQVAKENIENEYSTKFEVLNEMYDRAMNAGDHELAAKITDEIHTLQDEKSEATLRAKKNKRKLGKRVEWTSEREHVVGRPQKNREALAEFKANRKQSKKAAVGIEWLFEGALVVERGKSDMMIVTRIAGNKVECLKGGATNWYRNMKLRPAEWMLEE
jgi:hypothetical protein